VRHGDRAAGVLVYVDVLAEIVDVAHRPAAARGKIIAGTFDQSTVFPLPFLDYACRYGVLDAVVDEHDVARLAEHGDLQPGAVGAIPTGHASIVVIDHLPARTQQEIWIAARRGELAVLGRELVGEPVLAAFRVGSSILNADAKTKLDTIATKALNAKGYVLEVTGFADSTGATERNRQLSQRRADAVIRYLVENHQIPLRRIVTPYGFGESNPVAENDSREGRAQNRRVEVKLLVNKGLIQEAPKMTSSSSSGQ